MSPRMRDLLPFASREARRVKSVWSVAWLYNGKIQQAMYKED